MLKILALLVCTFIGFTPALSPLSAATSPPKTAASTHATVSDEQLEANIKTKLNKSKIGKDGFKFKVQHGIVTWEGTTNIAQHKGSATRMARSSGAVQVVNNIKVLNTAKDTVLRKAYVEP